MAGPLGFEPRSCGSEGFEDKSDGKNDGDNTVLDAGTVLIDFSNFMKVDLRLSPSSVRRHRLCIRTILEYAQGNLSASIIRSFLSGVKNPWTYNNYLKSFRIFCRDFMGREDLIKTFRFARPEFMPRNPCSRRELLEFYRALDDVRDRALYLLYASSGRRRTEILELKLDEIDINDRVIKPNKASATKRTWYSFFNEESRAALEEYLQVRRDVKRSGKLFPMSWEDRGTLFRMAQRKTGLRITPQTLRFWFANEMAKLGVPDRFIDAFQGRVPQSVLARHYTDYSLETLKEIYDKAGLKVLS